MISVNDEHWHGAVVQDVVTGASEQCRPNGAAAARAHHNEIVRAVGDLADQRRSDRLLGQHRSDRQAVGNALACATEIDLSFGTCVFAQLPDLFATAMYAVAGS